MWMVLTPMQYIDAMGFFAGGVQRTPEKHECALHRVGFKRA